MRTIAIPSILMLAFAGTAMCQATGDLPSADKLFEKYIEAQGGKAALEKVNSRVSKGTIEVTTFGVTGNMTVYAKAPNKMMSVSEFEGYGTVSQGFDGKAGWAEDPERGLRDLSGQELSRYQRSSDFHRALHLKDEYKKIAVTGKGKVGARDVYIVEAEPGEGGPEKLYFDIENGLMLRTDFPGQENRPTTVVLEDYKAVDGIQLPATIRQDTPELSLILRIEKVEHNTPIDDAKFSKPAPK